VSSFKPTIPLAYIESNLNFDSSEQCVEFLKEVGCSLDLDGQQLKLKESKEAVSQSKLLQGGFD